MSSSKIAFLFPGQASQSVGMGKDLVEAYDVARELFASADEALGFGLAKLCFEGPMEELTQTHNAQPAILLHSLAVHAILREHGVRAQAVAGHSLGEFSAACAAEAMSSADALRVVRRRGELMWEAGQRIPGTMAAVIGLELERCRELCAAASGEQVVVVANLNSPTQLVISGDVAAVERAQPALKEAGARRVMPLKVSGAFHSPLMEVVQPDFAEFLQGVELQEAGIPLYANVDAAPRRSAASLREGFVRQLVSPVRWHDSVAAMIADGAETLIEVGPGNVLANLGARSFPSAQFFSTSDAAGVEKVLASLT